MYICLDKTTEDFDTICEKNIKHRRKCLKVNLYLHLEQLVLFKNSIYRKNKKQILSNDRRISLKHHEMSFICREKSKKKHI